MKKLMKIMCVGVSMAMLMTACSSGGKTVGDTSSVSTEGRNVSDKDSYKMALVVNGNLGDKSFWDSCAKGMKLIEETYDNVQTKIVEAGTETTAWKPVLIDLSEQGYDLIYTCNQMQEILPEVAEMYPDQNYVIYDARVDAPNVYSAEVKQYEGAFLAGALAAETTSSGIEGTDGDNIIGIVGAMDIPVINDFVVGYISGAQYIDPDIKVTVSYVGSFSDPTKGKELALAQINSGADVIFQVAAASGMGILQAVSEKGVIGIGVDTDQAAEFQENNPAVADRIVTSVVKNMDMLILKDAGRYMDGTLEFGVYERVGIADKAIGLVDNENYKKMVSEEKRNKIAEVQTGILDGTIQAPSAIDMDNAEVKKIIDSVSLAH